MDNQANKKSLKDCAMIIVVLLIMWAVIAMVMVYVRGIIESATFRNVASVTGILVGVFATFSSMAIIHYLRKNKHHLYIDDAEEARC